MSSLTTVKYLVYVQFNYSKISCLCPVLATVKTTCISYIIDSANQYNLIQSHRPFYRMTFLNFISMSEAFCTNSNYIENVPQGN